MPSNMPTTNGDTDSTEGKVVDFHRCRFVDYQPPKITALAFSHPSNPQEPTPDSLLLAVGRSNGDIDIWSPHHNWVQKTTLRGGKDRSIEGISWVPAPAFQKYAPHRLFSIGSSTYLTEWDLATGIPKQHLDSNAGAIWSLAASADGTTLALGCEDGSIILVDVADGSFAYSRVLERQESRVLSLSWHPNGKILVGGCSDSTIRVWQVDNANGRIIAEMKVQQLKQKGIRGKRMRFMDTLVWAVKVTANGTVISGDSTGSLKIWESKFWSLKQSFQVHNADILCLSTDSNEQTIYSSGVDRKMMTFRRLADGKWTHSERKEYHKHDVRAMAQFESEQIEMIVSGGLDRSFSVLWYENSVENLRVLPPVPQERVMKFARNARTVISWSENQVKGWQIEAPTETELAEGEEEINHRYLLQMTCNEEENISAVAISSNAEYLLVATLSRSKFFSLLPSPATSKLTVEKLGTFPHGARLATFTPAGDAIVLVTPDSEVQIHPFLDEQAGTIRIPYTGERGSQINKIAMSPDGKAFATSSSSSLVIIQSFDPDIPSQSLPQPSSAITSLAFLTPDLISLTLADRNRLLLFQQRGDEWFLHPWCKDEGNMPMQIGITMDKCVGTFITNNDPSKVWLWGANWIAYVEPDGEKRPVVNPFHKPNRFQQESFSGNWNDKLEESPYWITYRYRELLLVDCLSSTSDKIELVVVERPRHEIMEDIAEPRFYSHQYGT